MRQEHRKGGLLVRAAAVAGTATLAASITGTGALAAAPTPSSVVTDPTSVTVAEAATQVVTARLDASCHQAIDGGLSYNIDATTGDSLVATVTRTTPGPLDDCTSGPLSFTVTGVACGATSVTFTPVVLNRNGPTPGGAQRKVASTTIPVTVTGECGGTGGEEPGARPAAPAVANQFIGSFGSKDGFLAQCQSTAYRKDGRLWRGVLVKDVAAFMPTPEGVKDDRLYFPEDSDWREYVIAGVHQLCAGNRAQSAFPAPTPAG